MPFMAEFQRSIRVALTCYGIACGMLAGAQAKDQVESIDRGSKIAEDACSPCHAIGRQGESPNPKAPLFREIGQRYDIDDLQESLAEGILTGHPDMPEILMTPEEIADFLAFLRTIQVRK